MLKCETKEDRNIVQLVINLEWLYRRFDHESIDYVLCVENERYTNELREFTQSD